MHALSRRERQKQELRERILDTARDLLIEQGLEGFSMRKLAAKIDYTPTAIYFHFPDKESLLLELIASDFLAFRAALGQMPAELPPLLKLRLMGRGYVAFATAHPQHYRLLFMTPGLPLLKQHLNEELSKPSATECCETPRPVLLSRDADHPLAHVQLACGDVIERGNPAQDAYAFLVQNVTAAVDADCFRPELTDPHLIAQTIWSSVHGVASLRIAKGHDQWIDWAGLQMTTNLIVDGLLRGIVRDPTWLDQPVPELPVELQIPTALPSES
jgi:AcrR family transcriptional regulator